MVRKCYHFEKCITSATPVLDSVSHDTQLSFGNDSISEPLNSLQNKVFTEHADHIIGIDNSSHTQEWLKITTLESIITKQGFGAIFGMFTTKCFKFYLYLPITHFFC
jgi:hypothetical protein